MYNFILFFSYQFN